MTQLTDNLTANWENISKMADKARTKYFEAVALVTFSDAASVQAEYDRIKTARAETDALDALNGLMSKYTLPKGVMAFVDKVTAHISAFSRETTETTETDSETGEERTVKVEAYTPRVTLYIDRSGDTPILKVRAGGVKRGRPVGSGSTSSNSRISAWEAYKRGRKSGDPNTIRKVKGGYKDGDRFIPTRANGGLQAYILRNGGFPETVKVLAKYGQDKVD